MNCFLKYIINRTIIKIFSSKMRSIYDVILGTILLDEYHLGSIWKEINGHKLKFLNYCMLEDWLIINERKGKTSWWARRAKSSSSSSLAHSKCEADNKPRKEWCGTIFIVFIQLFLQNYCSENICMVSLITPRPPMKEGEDLFMKKSSPSCKLQN